jgi:predicted RecA/RadA family phage recombinase
MKNYVQQGQRIEGLAPYDVASGGGFLIGVTFAVAAFTAVSGSPIVGEREGIFDMAKPGSQAWTAWTTKLYWDNSAKLVTSVSSGNTLIGVAAAAVGSGAGETTGRALLTGQLS